MPAVGLLPSGVAGFWGSYRLRGLGHAIPRAAGRVRRAGRRPPGWPAAPLRLLLAGAMAGLLADRRRLRGAALCSPRGSAAPPRRRAAAGFGLLAPAMLLAGVLESLGRAGRAARPRLRRRGGGWSSLERRRRRSRASGWCSPAPSRRAAAPSRSSCSAARRARWPPRSGSHDRIARSPTRLAVARGRRRAALAVLLVGARVRRRARAAAALLIPAYVPPRRPCSSAGARSTRPQLLVVNPASGPGAERDDAYARRRARARSAAGARVLGYVPHGLRRAPGRGRGRHRPLRGVVRGRRHLPRRGGRRRRAAPVLPRPRAARRARAAAARRAQPGHGARRAATSTSPTSSSPSRGPYAPTRRALERAPAGSTSSRPSASPSSSTARRASRRPRRARRRAGYVYATSGVLPHPWRTVPSSSEHAKELTALCD